MRIIPEQDVEGGTERNGLGLPAPSDHKSLPVVDGPSHTGRTRLIESRDFEALVLSGLPPPKRMRRW